MFAGMAGSGWANLVKTWPTEDKLLLESSWRKSTLKTYSAAWKRWILWTTENNCKSDNPTVDEVAKYICFLQNKVKLAPKTIALHKSVVITFANPQTSEMLSSHPLIQHILKAIHLSRPPTVKTLTWNISQLIDYLQKYEVNTSSLFQVSRHTAALLLLASGRRIHDLTLLDISPKSCELKDDYVILWPIFGSKTDSATFRQSGWKFIPSDNERLDAMSWIKKLITLSDSRRASVQNVHNLFISTRGKVKPATRSIIAGWIRTLFNGAEIRASPGTFRSAVNSDNWCNGNLNMDEVLMRGNWRSRDTFIKYYFKEIPPSNIGSINRIAQQFSPQI